MDHKFESVPDIVELISKLLDSGKERDAINLTTLEKYQRPLRDNCWDLVPVIINKIEDNTLILKPSLYSTCEELLSIIAHKANAEEALLEFIEQIEVAKNDLQFIVVLLPLQKVLLKLITKRGRSLEWCLNAISNHLENIPIPIYQLEGKERILMDSEGSVRRTFKLYSEVITFYKPFIEEIEVINTSIPNARKNFIAFTVGLFGKPLVHIDFDPENNATSEGRSFCTKILQDIFVLEKDFIKLLSYLEVKSRSSKRETSNDEDLDIYLNEDKMTLTSLSSLAYTVLSNDFIIPEYSIPQIYSSEYIVQTNLLAVTHLLSFSDYGCQFKGLSLCKSLLARFPDPAGFDLLMVPVHFELLKKLVHLSIFSTFETVRKNAVTLIGIHINKFEFKARCLLFKSLLEVANHSGMIGYAITLYKNSINQAFSCEKFPKCFQGQQFENLLKKICFLPNGVESDIVELADQIISALNFLRYILLRDSDNLTGVRECIPYIENIYLNQLRMGLQMAKAHYEMKLRDIEAGKSLTENEVNVSIAVGGNILDKIPKEKQKEIINSALNAFHLIDGLLARVSECIDIHKNQIKPM